MFEVRGLEINRKIKGVQLAGHVTSCNCIALHYWLTVDVLAYGTTYVITNKHS